MVVFPECKRVFDKVKDVVSPCIIEVISSVKFQVRISKCNNKFSACLAKNRCIVHVRFFEQIADSP